jgi:SAM-dependent methyltransferase
VADAHSVEARQSAHYDSIAAAYEAHYSDRWSVAYCYRYMYGPMLEGVALDGRSVLDAMAGTGKMTSFLLRRGAEVTALDVSSEVLELLRAKEPNVRTLARSAMNTGLPDASVDVVTAVQGLHHVQPHAAAAVAEFHRILRPGGWFVFAEPHEGSVFDTLRRAWYRLDPLFEANEQAIDLDQLELANRDRFEFVSRRYRGNLAYLLVYNSMVFRVPHPVKALYSPAALWLEGRLQRFQTRRTSCMVIAQWRKRG